jgi:hypothetical protein
MLLVYFASLHYLEAQPSLSSKKHQFFHLKPKKAFSNRYEMHWFYAIEELLIIYTAGTTNTRILGGKRNRVTWKGNRWGWVDFYSHFQPRSILERMMYIYHCPTPKKNPSTPSPTRITPFDEAKD